MLYVVEFFDWSEKYLVECDGPAEAILRAYTEMAKEAGEHKVVEKVYRADFRLLKKKAHGRKKG